MLREATQFKGNVEQNNKEYLKIKTLVLAAHLKLCSLEHNPCIVQMMKGRKKEHYLSLSQPPRMLEENGRKTEISGIEESEMPRKTEVLPRKY
jgi:hypothetical protein